MQSLTQPELLLKPFADEGDRNSIPDKNKDTSNLQLADLTNGFPEITSKAPSAGGLPPERKDFNALGYLTTLYDFFYQAGGTFTYNATIASAIGGYPLGARLWYTDNSGVACILRSTIGNNTNNFLTDPTVIGEVGSGKPWVIDRFRGYNTIYTLFDTKWTDYEINSEDWLRADTFSWQSGVVYADAYNHLASDITGKTAQTETIGSYTITYYLATDGHKIVLANQETAVQNIYNESGVAWYYILDTTNTRFKLPRTKFGFTGIRDGVGKYVGAGLPNHTHATGRQATNNAGRFVWNSSNQDYVLGSQAGRIDWNGSEGFDRRSSLSSGSSLNTGLGQNYTLSTSLAKTDNVASDGVFGKSTTVQPPATQMYLYFYVGQFSQTATEQTAGLNSELFNGKADVDLSNAAPNASASAKQTMVGWGMPDFSRGVSKSKGSSSSPNTTSTDCVVVFSGQSTSSDGSGAVLIVNTGSQWLELQGCSAYGVSALASRGCVYLPKNTQYYMSTATFHYCYEFPLKGV